MENKLKVINRYIVDKDSCIHNAIHLIDNKSIWKKLFIILVKYSGSLRRVSTTIIENKSRVKIESVMINHFVNGECYYYDLKIRNGLLRESDSIYNEDFERKVDNLYNLICKNNSYTESEFTSYRKEIKSK